MKNDRYYGIDVGGTSVKIGLLEGDALVDRWEIPTDTSQEGINILPDIVRSLKPGALGAGLAVPGAVEGDGTVNRCVNLGWGVCRPGQALGKAAGIPCHVLNDANAAALGEQRFGGGRGWESILLVTLGTGVGGGLVLGGELVAGGRGTAGELGHICLDPAGPMCSCGNRGCLEQYCSATGIMRLAREAGLDAASCKDVFSLAQAGDGPAQSVVNAACDALGRGIAAACALFDPEAVILGGGVAQAGEFLRAKAALAFEKYAFHACRGTPIRLAILGPDAGMMGAACYAREKCAGL